MSNNDIIKLQNITIDERKIRYLHYSYPDIASFQYMVSVSNAFMITQLIKIEQAICDSHFKEKLNEESISVAKIKSDPNFFFRYAKKISICKSDIDPIKKNTHNYWLMIGLRYVVPYY